MPASADAAACSSKGVGPTGSTGAAELLAAWFPQAHARIAVTGNPRIDLFRPALLDGIRENSARIRREHGRFILFNLNYTTINSNRGDTLDYFDTCVKARVYRPNDATDDRLFRDLIQWEYDNLGAMTQAIVLLEENALDVGT